MSCSDIAQEGQYTGTVVLTTSNSVVSKTFDFTINPQPSNGLNLNLIVIAITLIVITLIIIIGLRIKSRNDKVYYAGGSEPEEKNEDIHLIRDSHDSSYLRDQSKKP